MTFNHSATTRRTSRTGSDSYTTLLDATLLTIGCVMATRELERRLHSTVRAQRVGQAANNLRAHPNWEGIITALLRLHEYLQANPPPIDYQRRRSLNYDNLLPTAHWVDLVAEQGAGAPVCGLLYYRRLGERRPRSWLHRW
jgi:hypothetical protein